MHQVRIRSFIEPKYQFLLEFMKNPEMHSFCNYSTKLHFLIASRIHFLAHGRHNIHAVRYSVSHENFIKYVITFF